MKTKQFLLILLACLCFPFAQLWSNPVNGLLERIDSGASKKFIIQVKKGQSDFFELDQKGDKVVIRGNNYVNIATGLNWYLKYYAGIHLSWNGMTAELPESLPKVSTPVRKETNLALRYDFNYCTYSYTMAFWDWERWEKEIDWMALHGINLPLAVVGQECVWKNMLEKLGYTKEEINKFIAGPAFLAWWAMNNLEGWGGPNPDSWYTQQEALQKKILKRMREYGIEPVFPGYSGMVPHDANKKLGLNVTEPALWNGFTLYRIFYQLKKRILSIIWNLRVYYLNLIRKFVVIFHTLLKISRTPGQILYRLKIFRITILFYAGISNKLRLPNISQTIMFIHDRT